MSGPIVRTGASPKFYENWTKAFGDGSKASKKAAAPEAAKKGAKKAPAKKAAPKKAAKKKGK